MEPDKMLDELKDKEEKLRNELVELDWKLDLLSDMKDLHNYFMQKIKKPYEIVNYGDDYPDYFKNYYQ